MPGKGEEGAVFIPILKKYKVFLILGLLEPGCAMEV